MWHPSHLIPSRNTPSYYPQKPSSMTTYTYNTPMTKLPLCESPLMTPHALLDKIVLTKISWSHTKYIPFAYSTDEQYTHPHPEVHLRFPFVPHTDKYNIATYRATPTIMTSLMIAYYISYFILYSASISADGRWGWWGNRAGLPEVDVDVSDYI